MQRWKLFASIGIAVALLWTGTFDAVAIFEPYVSDIAAQLGADGVLFSEPQLYVKRFLLTTSQHLTEQRPDVVRKLLRALLRAVAFTRANPARAAQDVAQQLGIKPTAAQQLSTDAILEVTLDQALLLTLEQEAAWLMQQQVVTSEDVPNFLRVLFIPGLQAVAPQAVTVY
jgi:ABC-type nitrate/sulfonate/bicarbonate transport system substrate-binding protein